MEVIHDGARGGRGRHPAQEYLASIGYKRTRAVAPYDALFERAPQPLLELAPASSALTAKQLEQKIAGPINAASMTLEEKVDHWEAEFYYRTEHHEDGVRTLLLELAIKLPANSVVVDSGAHVGDTGLSLAQGLRAAGRKDVHVLMVEPDASKVAWINKKLGQEGDLFASVFNSGLYSVTTRANIVRAKHPGSWKVVPNVADGEVQLRAISEILASERPNDNFGLWHLDVEGTEEHALRGLGTHQPRHILMEVIHDGARGGPGRHPAQEYLASIGYKRTRAVAPYDALFEHAEPN